GLSVGLGRYRYDHDLLECVDLLHRIHLAFALLWRHAALRLFAGHFRLPEGRDRPTPLPGPLVQLARELRAIHGVDQVEELGGVPGLVRLQLPDEVPRHGSPELGDLRARLLNPVLAEGRNPGGDRLADPGERNGP